MKPSEVKQIIDSNTREEIVQMAIRAGVESKIAEMTPSRELIDEIEARNEGFATELTEGFNEVEIEGSDDSTVEIPAIEIEMSLKKLEGDGESVIGAALDQYIEKAVGASSAEEVLEAMREYKQVFTDNCGPEYTSEEEIDIDSSVDIGYVNAIVCRRRGQTMEEFNRFMGWTQ